MTFDMKFNPLWVNFLFLHPLKTENQRFFDAFRGYILEKKIICDVLPDLIPFVQFEKCPLQKNTHRGVLLLVELPATLLKVTLHCGCFSCVLNCITYISDIFRFALRRWRQQRNLVNFSRAGTFSLISY